MNVPAKEVRQQSLSEDLEVLRPELSKVLPEHVTTDRFLRVVMTAIAQSPDLRNADRRSLLTSCVKCAQDGLLPDGREAALVIFGGKATYMPMVAGILKKVRNSGELQSLTANVVYEQDAFDYWVDDIGEHVKHKPNITVADRGKLLAVYAIAKTLNGGVYVEVMSRGQVEQVRDVSKAKNKGPWVSWYDEMARKTVIRRLSKRLPMSTDLETVVTRDDQFYDLNQVSGRSGVDAAKRALGLPQLPENDEPAEDDEAPANVDTETGEHIPQFNEALAIKALESKRTTHTLDEAWSAIAEDFKLTGRELPMAVEARYNDLREGLQEREAS